MGKAIENLELFENGKLAVIKITDDLLRSVGAKEEDCEGIVNIGRNIEGVEVAVAIRERPGGELKINFRSKIMLMFQLLQTGIPAAGTKERPDAR